MFNPIVFNEDVCTGCNICVDVCLMEILEASPEKGRSPIVGYPDECAYDGACIFARSRSAFLIKIP